MPLQGIPDHDCGGVFLSSVTVCLIKTGEDRRAVVEEP